MYYASFISLSLFSFPRGLGTRLVVGMCIPVCTESMHIVCMLALVLVHVLVRVTCVYCHSIDLSQPSSTEARVTWASLKHCAPSSCLRILCLTWLWSLPMLLTRYLPLLTQHSPSTSYDSLGRTTLCNTYCQRVTSSLIISHVHTFPVGQ